MINGKLTKAQLDQASKLAMEGLKLPISEADLVALRNLNNSFIPLLSKEEAEPIISKIKGEINGKRKRGRPKKQET